MSASNRLTLPVPRDALPDHLLLWYDIASLFTDAPRDFGQCCEALHGVLHGQPIGDNLWEIYEVANHAVTLGHVTCLHALFVQIGGVPLYEGIQFENMYMTTAIQHNQLHMLEYMFLNLGFTLTADLSKTAAAFGSVPILKFLKDHNCPWSPLTLDAAAMNGQKECLLYVIDNGMPFDMGNVERAESCDTPRTLECAMIMRRRLA